MGDSFFFNYFIIIFRKIRAEMGLQAQKPFLRCKREDKEGISMVARDGDLAPLPEVDDREEILTRSP